MERTLNRYLEGYSVRLSGLHFQLVGLTMHLKGLTGRQDAHPDTPVAEFHVIRSGIHWSAIFSRRLVAAQKVRPADNRQADTERILKGDSSGVRRGSFPFASKLPGFDATAGG